MIATWFVTVKLTAFVMFHSQRDMIFLGETYKGCGKFVNKHINGASCLIYGEYLEILIAGIDRMI